MYKYTPVDPIRYPKIQKSLENEFKKNFGSSLQVMLAQITKVLKNEPNRNSQKYSE